MAESVEKAKALLKRFSAEHAPDEWEAGLRPDCETPYEPLPSALVQDDEASAKLLDRTPLDEADRDILCDPQTRGLTEHYRANIENFVGTVKIPVGIAGPIRIRGSAAQGDYLLPLATHEAALVASYHRGAVAISESGGCTAVVLNEGVSRVPVFCFDNLREAAAFLAWSVQRKEEFQRVAQTTTRHGHLEDIKITVEGGNVFLHFEYSTGDAAGQNMVTIATQAVVEHILEASPVAPRRSYIESNLSGDKKASAISFGGVRGRKVTCEATIGPEVLRKRLGTNLEDMEDYWRVSSIGGVLSGTLGIQGHYANGLAALFLACGQDAACVAEAAVGVTRFERRGEALYAAVTLPNLITGTVGGGTGLPSQTACLKVLGLAGSGHAPAFAEVCAATALAGELSIIAALASGRFARAHEILARRRARRTGP